MKEIVLINDVGSPATHQLKTGKFSATYEGTRLRYIFYDGQEVLRMIYPALRSEEWETIRGTIEDERVELNEKGFHVSFKQFFDKGNIRYRSECEIFGEGNTIEYIMRGQALSSFKSKRIGLCVHHPIHNCAGRPVTIEHEDGNKRHYQFPTLISPVWPFTDIRAMEWRVNGLDLHLQFEGDLFETEDQRNWTDDSFKTYSGPQYKTPMLDIHAGDTMMHRIVLHVAPVRFAFPKIEGRDYRFLRWNGKDAMPNVEVGMETLIAVENLDPSLYESAKKNYPQVKWGLQKDTWFADINAAQLEQLRFDFVDFVVSPQVHQDDHLSTMENLGSQHDTLDVLKMRTNGKPAHISLSYKDSSGTAFETWWLLNAIYNLAEAGYLHLGAMRLSPQMQEVLSFQPKFITKTVDGHIVLENGARELLTIKFQP